MKALATAGLAFRRTRFALKHENTTLGVGCTSTCESENCVTFAFDDGPPLRLSLGGYQECGTGGQLWDASVVLALFLRAHAGLVRDQIVVELGAGCGLPGIDVARRGVARSVTLTDVMLALAEANAQQNGADVRVARYDWSETATACNFACDVLLGADVCYSPLHAHLLAQVVRDTEAPIAVFASLANRSDFGTLVKLLEDEFREVQEHAITLLCHDADDERDAAGLGVAPTAPLEVAFRVVVVRART
jgi:predicted nicotinamide N-methyase